MNIRATATLRTLLALAVLVMMDSAWAEPSAATKPESAARPATENAALDYLRATIWVARADLAKPGGSATKLLAAVTKTGATDEEILAAVKEFNPKARHPFKAAMQSLHRGAGKPWCDFARPADDLTAPEAADLRALARAAAVEARIFGAEKDYKSAGVVLADLLQMAMHYGQQGIMLDELVSAAIQGMACNELRVLLMPANKSRLPDQAAIEYVKMRLDTMNPRELDLAGIAERDNKWTDNYIANEITRDWQTLSEKERRARIDKHFPAVGDSPGLDAGMADLFAPYSYARKTLLADLDQAPEIIKGWRDEAAKQPDYPIEAIRKRYSEARGELMSFDKNAAEFVAAFKNSGRMNPWIIHSFTPWQYLQWVGFRGNSEVQQVRILTAAALIRARTGSYPGSLEALAWLFPNGLPKDPYNDKDFKYELKNDLPQVTSAYEFADEFVGDKNPMFAVLGRSATTQKEK